MSSEVEWESLLTKLKIYVSIQQLSVTEYAATENAITLEVQTNPSRPGSPGSVEKLNEKACQ